MPLNPLLFKQIKQPNATKKFSDTLANIASLDTLKQNKLLAPILQQQQEALLANQQAVTESNQLQNLDTRSASRLQELGVFGSQVKSFLDAGDIPGARNFALNRLGQLAQRIEAGEDVDTTETEQFLDLLDTNPKLAAQRADQAIDLANQLTGKSNLNRIQSSQFIPGKGFATITAGGETGFKGIPGLGETKQQLSEREQEQRIQLEKTKSQLQGKSAAVKAAVSKGSKVFDSIAPIGVAIANFDDAIKAIDDGADTGVISSMLPSFRESSILLDAIQNRLGLDVIGSTTFGALSESELAFALRTALPTNLQPEALREWLVAKKRAQQKVKERLEEAASFLSDGTHTIKDWIEFDAARQLNQVNQTDQPTGQQTITVDF